MEKVLVIRFSSIGDIVLTTPVVRCLKKQIPGCEVHYLTKRKFESVIKANPYIDRIYLYDHDFKGLIPELKAEGFTWIADLHKNYRSAFVKQQLNIASASFSKLNFRKWLIVNFKWNFLPDIHIVDRYFQAVSEVNVVNDHLGLDYFLDEKDEVPLNSLPESHRRGFVAVVTGAKHQTKIFPVEKVAEVCRRLAYPVILLGGKDEAETGDEIVNQTSPLVFNACGKFHLNQSASIVKNAKCVLSNDTGLMHIAAAFRKPVVSVWGNTVPEFGMYPCFPEKNQADQYIAEVKNLKCRPCSKIGHQQCPKKHFKCMNDIDIQPIVDFLRNHLS